MKNVSMFEVNSHNSLQRPSAAIMRLFICRRRPPLLPFYSWLCCCSVNCRTELRLSLLLRLLNSRSNIELGSWHWNRAHGGMKSDAGAGAGVCIHTAHTHTQQQQQQQQRHLLIVSDLFWHISVARLFSRRARQAHKLAPNQQLVQSKYQKKRQNL